MNKNEKFVITINRELGSGGRTIGKKLAERLNVPFYDKALIKALTKKYKLSVKEIEEMKGRNHSWWAEFKRAMNIGAEMGVSQYHYRAKFSDMPDMLTTDEMFSTEQEVLRGIATDESCVIAGRSGFFVFREHPNHLSILIQASMNYRIERVARKQNLTAEEARKAIEQVDKMRENYVKKYTGFSRYDTRNYDLVLRADGKTEDELVDIILQYMK
ncbi:MAG: cytidylate kinase-like family protein [Bacteroidaceae bacterium]|nr:cytidylate kinase-like family protein [Bacteroidaceae bacterium]